jgi:hypothetical protein
MSHKLVKKTKIWKGNGNATI